MSEEQMFGWYSQMAVDAGHGSAIWSTEEGPPVEVTSVVPSDTYDEYVWPDKKLLGKVCQFVSLRRRPSYGYGERLDHSLR